MDHEMICQKDMHQKKVIEMLNNIKEKILCVRGNCDAEVDQMLLDFPIMETYALLVDNGKRYLLTMVMFIIRKTCQRVLTRL